LVCFFADVFVTFVDLPCFFFNFDVVLAFLTLAPERCFFALALVTFADFFFTPCLAAVFLTEAFFTGVSAAAVDVVVVAADLAAPWVRVRPNDDAAGMRPRDNTPTPIQRMSFLLTMISPAGLRYVIHHAPDEGVASGTRGCYRTPRDGCFNNRTVSRAT
jgi:hypothetical protein